jgi:hypothetical protein
MSSLRFEYVEFKGTVEFLIGVNAYFSAPGIRPYIPVDQYGGYLMHMTPITGGEEPVILVFIAKGSLPAGIVEFDLGTKSYTKVESITRPDKLYFVTIEPSYSSIAELAIREYEEKRKPVG